MPSLLHRSRNKCIAILRWLNGRRSFWIRFALCWMVGWVSLKSFDATQFDLRFQLRSAQKVSGNVILIKVSPTDIRELFYKSRFIRIIPLEETTEYTDSFYWDKKFWRRLLEEILKQNPQKVGVNFFFGDNLGPLELSNTDNRIFEDSRIIWANSLNNSERLLWPHFSLDNRSNVGSNEIYRDEDGVVRRILPTLMDNPHLVERLTGINFDDQKTGLLINYRGGKDSLQTVAARDILNGEIPSDYFRGKIILIGSSEDSSSQLLTPLGLMSKTEVLGQALETMVGQQKIAGLPHWLYGFLLLFMLLLCVSLIRKFPQGIAFFFMTWIVGLFAALSAWSFDSLALWIPFIPAFALSGTSWIVFIGYQTQKIEKRNFELEQEQKYSQEVEQLKNNFISLISHDLKTPIAKIQAVTDRMMRENPNLPIEQDLASLRSYSEELYRYIQSILKVTKVESKDFELQMDVSDLNEIILQVIDQVKPLANEKQIEISTQLEPLFSLEFDPTLIKEVILNIVENAVKYSSQNCHVNIATWELDDFVFCKVSDTGEGIKSDDLEKIWGKFTRGSDQDLKTKGTGLGLYLVKYFIELHGGKVEIDTLYGKGTSVTFTLPTA